MVEQLRSLIERLIAQGAFGEPDLPVQLVETHISILVLGASRAWKFKKPVDLGFVDFSTLARRRAACEAEVRLNARLSPELYDRVVSVGGTPEHPYLDGEPAIEYCVAMQRFAADAELPRALAAGRIDARAMRALAADLAAFHASAEHPGRQWDTAQALARHSADNFDALRRLPAFSEHSAALDELESWTRSRLSALAPLLDARQRRGRVRLGHGDLHAGNMIWSAGRIRVFDCIEFSESLRTLDVLDEIGFAVMDLERRGYAGLAAVLLDAYLEHTGDYDGVALLPLFCSYRALVRAKVTGLSAAESHEAEDTAEAQAYLSLARRYAQPRECALVLMHGLSGSGKSTLAAQLVEPCAAVRIRSDVERQRLLANATPPVDDPYSCEWTQRTYTTLAGACESVIRGGRSAIADAVFLTRAQRNAFNELALRLGCPLHIIHCHAPTDVLRARVEARSQAGTDASQADVAVLEQQLMRIEPLDDSDKACVIRVDTSRDIDIGLVVRSLGLT